MVKMEAGEDGFRPGSIPNSASRNISSSSSAFFSANQSPFFSPNLTVNGLSTNSNTPCHNAVTSEDTKDTTLEDATRESFERMKLEKLENASCSRSSYGTGHKSVDSRQKDRGKRIERSLETAVSPSSFFSNRLRSCDVYVGFHGGKPLLQRFTNWLRAELELQGLSCFVTDRARCRNSHKHGIVEKAMDVCTFGVIILTRKSFRNPFTIEELRYFSAKKNLVPIYFDLSPDDCLVRDIIEKRGELWEKYGGELWLLYGGLENEWKDAIIALSRHDEWKLEARDGKWRDCVLRAVTLLALRLGRRSVVDRLAKWREKAEKEEFPYTQNENFIGRKKELSELEFMLFGDITGEAEKDYFTLKSRPIHKNLTIDWGRTNSTNGRRKGKEPIVWKESEMEIEMQNTEFSMPCQHTPRPKGKGRRKRSKKVEYGKGIACVSGESGIGKTELVLEFSYRFHQMYKMVLWIGGESRYIRQNYLNLWPFLEIDVGVESCHEGTRTKSFEDQEEEAIARVRKELMRDIPFLLIIDNLESEKDWWDRKSIMDLLPRFGGETHVIISTRLSSVMNLDPLKLSYLSAVDAMSLMLGSVKDVSITEIDALRAIEEKLGRLTLGLAIIGAILSELPINPARLLDTINRMPLREAAWSGRETVSLRRNNFLLQLFEVCFSIFDHADGPRSLATRMALASGWFAPGSIPVPVLALAARKIPEKHKHRKLMNKILTSLSCGFASSHARKSEGEASSVLLRFSVGRACKQEGFIQFNQLVKLYARKRGTTGLAQAMVRAVISRGFKPSQVEHVWAACFLLLGFGKDPVVVELKASELIFVVREVILPLAIRTFIVFSRCSAALELLRLCTDLMEAMDQEFVAPVEKWLDKSFCWKPVRTKAEMNPLVWRELALVRATVVEDRAKLMVRGGRLDVGDDLIRKAIYIRSSILGENHPETLSARETLSKITRLLASVEDHSLG